ncbi:MAG: hypothetical protein LAT77_06745 [Aliidiomarina sp.]|uniref:hypothetical protein n=1 Tax=Aliidiomarina sp. TaxID=1872439 RepID=UPI0025C18E65|nr:hypothetical protein [Aliidiomarina sp.]MCH8501593.1 hypothetical protein [Aliidiomarina sp.]
MKACVIGGFALLMLAGCTSTGGYQTAAKSEIDWDKVNQVERSAATGSNRVIWVNPPLKEVERNNPSESNNGSQ